MGRRAGLPVVFTDDEHGDVFQYRFTVKKRRRRGSTYVRDDGTSESKAAAQAIADRHFDDARKGKAPAKPERRSRGARDSSPLKELFAAFAIEVGSKVADSYAKKWQSHFRAHFGPRWSSLDEVIEPGAIDRYATDRLTGKALHPKTKNNPNPKKPGSVTVSRELVTLRRFLDWCKRRGHIDEVPHYEPVAAVSDYKPPDYTPENALALLQALPDRHQHRKRRPVREFFLVQWSQARRPGEIESLRWQDVNLQQGVMTVRPSRDKARKGILLPLAPEAHQVLAELRKERSPLPSSLVFGRGNYRRTLAVVAERLGLPVPTRHNLRHFRLSELGDSPGTAVGALQFFAGHLHLSTTDKYVRSRTEAARAMLEALPAISTRSGSKKKAPRRKALPENDTEKKASRRKH